MASDSAGMLRSERLDAALGAAGIGTWSLELGTGEAAADDTARRLLGLRAGIVRGGADALFAAVHPQDRGPAAAALRKAVEAPDGLYDAEHRFVGSASPRWLMLRGRTVFAAEGAARKPVRLAGIVMDVTARRLAEESRELVLRELTHRVKNLIAVVQSIADLSGRAAPEAAGFLDGFRGRLAALAAAHNLLLGRDWHGARLPPLVAAVLAPFVERSRNRIELDIGDAPLAPQEAQTLALLLHELATNALKYGALSVEHGRVALTASVEANGELRLEWRESGGPGLTGPPSRSGFGLLMLERAPRHQHAGETEFEWAPEGLVCRLRLRLSGGPG